MLDIFLLLEKAIKAVLLLHRHEIEKFVVDKLLLEEEDQEIIRQAKDFYALFRKPTIEAQADVYPTLYRTIPQLILLRRKLTAIVADDLKPLCKVAAAAAFKLIDDYFKKIMVVRGPAVAGVINPRLKLFYFQWALKDDSIASSSTTLNRIKQHFEKTFRAYKRRQRDIEEAKRLDQDDIFMSDPPLTPEPNFDDLNDPFYRFVDNRHFHDVSEETQYLAKRLVP